jgi:lipid II:glycine glycyltransferase (peptidoglycan interpeptide bridge formation enzyme)
MDIFLDQNYQDQFLVQQNISGAFLQSSAWEKFLIAQGKNTWRFSFKEKEELLGTCLLYENKLFLGKSYLMAAKGPIFYKELSETKKLELVELFFSSIRDITINTKKYQELFFRIEPKSFFKIKELQRSLDIDPRETWITDINKPLSEILKASHPKTRYNIALAQKKGVEISFSNDKKDITIFLDLLNKTAQRQKIGIHPKEYFELWAETLFVDNFSELAIASIAGQPIAASLMVCFGNIATYVHGASDYAARTTMAPHYLHWSCLKRYQEQAYKFYDWWGIAPQDGSKPSLEGVSRFKLGFAGERQVAPGTYDFIYEDSWYKAYQIFRKLRRSLK